MNRKSNVKRLNKCVVCEWYRFCHFLRHMSYLCWTLPRNSGFDFFRVKVYCWITFHVRFPQKRKLISIWNTVNLCSNSVYEIKTHQTSGTHKRKELSLFITPHTHKNQSKWVFGFFYPNKRPALPELAHSIRSASKLAQMKATFGKSGGKLRPR